MSDLVKQWKDKNKELLEWNRYTRTPDYFADKNVDYGDRVEPTKFKIIGHMNTLYNQMNTQERKKL